MAVDDRADEALGTTVGVLIRALRALGRHGDPDAANRLAAQAWLALRDGHPRQAEQINGTMHYLVRLPQRPDGESRIPSPDQEST